MDIKKEGGTRVQEEIIKEESDSAGVQLLDWYALQESCLYKESLVNKLLDLYLQQLTGWLNELRGAVEKNDPEMVRRICHTVRGATAAIHAPACVASLERLNILAREGELADSSKIMSEVTFALEQTGVVITRLLKECSAT